MNKELKKMWSLLLLCLMAVTSVSAQTADFQKAVARYKGVKIVTAAVTKTAHKNAIAKDVVTKGTLTMQAPSKVSIVMDGGKDQLLMQGSDFTMVVKGKKHVTSSKKNTQFASFQTVFESIMSGGAKSIAHLNDLSISKRGGSLVLTITPAAADKKAARRMLFSSFVLTLDAKTGALHTLRMNERKGYTEYTFSHHQYK